jgi:type I restriction enzyme S subunit
VNPAQWEWTSLGAIIAALESGVSVNGIDEPVHKSSEIGVLKVSCVSGGRFLPDENKRVVEADTQRVAVSPRRGDIVVSRANTHELVGASGLVKEDRPNLFLSDKLWLAKLADSERDYPEWLVALLNSRMLRRELLRRATGTSGSMKNIPQDRFLSIAVPRPPAADQRLLSRAFAGFETVSEALERQVDAKCAFKRGLVQQLLTGQKRFPEFVKTHDRQSGQFGTIPTDWGLLHIGEVANETSGRGAVDGSIVYSCTKHDGLVPSMEYFGKQVFSRNLDGYKRLAIGDFAYATNHIEEGSIGLLKEGMAPGLVSPMYTVFTPSSKIVPEFLFALLKMESYRRVFEARMSASVDRRGSLRWGAFARIKLGVPSVEEQDRIVEVLRLADQELDQLARLRELIETQKCGLLSRLLSGELKVPA